MLRRCSLEAECYSASMEEKIHHHTQKRSALARILSSLNPVHNFTSYISKNSFLYVSKVIPSHIDFGSELYIDLFFSRGCYMSTHVLKNVDTHEYTHLNTWFISTASSYPKIALFRSQSYWKLMF
jgi:hypothetical protein